MESRREDRIPWSFPVTPLPTPESYSFLGHTPLIFCRRICFIRRTQFRHSVLLDLEKLLDFLFITLHSHLYFPFSLSSRPTSSFVPLGSVFRDHRHHFSNLKFSDFTQFVLSLYRIKCKKLFSKSNDTPRTYPLHSQLSTLSRSPLLTSSGSSPYHHHHLFLFLIT